MAKEDRKYTSRCLPETLKSIEEWKLSRRKFMGSMLAGGIATTIPSISIYGNGNYDSNVLSASQISIVSAVQKILFPSDNNGPGAYDVMADKYLLWVLSDIRMDPEEKEYIINGIGWVDETAEEKYSENFNKLSQSEKETLITEISTESWGTSWLSVMLTFIFEALLSDPQYGGNPDEIGWEWLKHNLGYPRPTKPLLYPEILTTVSKNTD